VVRRLWVSFFFLVRICTHLLIKFYSYRDGVQHHSILSSLSASYNGIGELSYYDDLARNIDVNLAEVDIENFRGEDINSLLKIRQDESGVPRTLHLKDPTEIDNSICKSEILFSPVKESHISVDSLDNMLDGYPEDIILTCQANKNNYTIAFEGSCMYSDESYYGELFLLAFRKGVDNKNI
jgi:iporin